MSVRIERLAAALVVALLAGWASADDKPEATGPDAAGLFKQLDANSDGFVTEDEVPADKQRLLRRLMRTADKDKDGKLNQEELAAGLQGSRPERPLETAAEPPRGPGGEGRPDPAALFRRMDTNGDGKVTKDEVPEERRERFSRLMELADRDGDGVLTLEELTKVADRLPGRPGQGAPGRPQGRPGQGTPGERPDGPPEGDVVFRALDRDGDGKLSADEIRKASDSLAALDKDGDGSITIAELRRARPAGPSGQTDGGRPNPEMFVRRLMRGDKNGDGKLSQDELPERLQRAFERIDANHDGFVDESELKAGLERMRGAASGQGNEARGQRPRNRPQENAKPAAAPGAPADGS